jgi:hypothetical protein
MTRALLLPLVLTTGCLVVPTTRTTTRDVGTEDGAATFAKATDLQVTTRVESSTLHVQAKRVGECTQQVFAITETTRKKGARMGGATDPRARALGFLVAPVTIPISALITGLAVAADQGTTSRDTRAIAIKRFACTLEASHMTVGFVLPSGKRIERTTTRDGRIDLEIPATEPYEGTIAMTLPAQAAREVAYALPKPAVTAARDAITTCAAQHGISGDITAKLSIDGQGRATRVWLSRGDAALGACVSGQIRDARFPDLTHDTTLTVPLSVGTAKTAKL